MSTEEGALDIDDRLTYKDDTNRILSHFERIQDKTRNEKAVLLQQLRNKKDTRSNARDYPSVPDGDEAEKPTLTTVSLLKEKSPGALTNIEPSSTNTKVVSPESKDKYKEIEPPYSWESTDGNMQINLEKYIYDEVNETMQSNYVTESEVYTTEKKHGMSKYKVTPETTMYWRWREEIMNVAEANRLGYKQHILRLISNRFRLVWKAGKAIESIVLLRRCLYPKRDVIRWASQQDMQNIVREGALYI